MLVGVCGVQVNTTGALKEDIIVTEIRQALLLTPFCVVALTFRRWLHPGRQ